MCCDDDGPFSCFRRCGDKNIYPDVSSVVQLGNRETSSNNQHPNHKPGASFRKPPGQTQCGASKEDFSCKAKDPTLTQDNIYGVGHLPYYTLANRPLPDIVSAEGKEPKDAMKDGLSASAKHYDDITDHTYNYIQPVPTPSTSGYVPMNNTLPKHSNPGSNHNANIVHEQKQQTLPKCSTTQNQDQASDQPYYTHMNHSQIQLLDRNSDSSAVSNELYQSADVSDNHKYQLLKTNNENDEYMRPQQL